MRSSISSCAGLATLLATPAAGPESLDGPQATRVFFGASAGDGFGTSVRGAGDVDADGYDDLIVGAPFADNQGVDAGSARVLSGRDGTVLFTFEGDSAGDEFGTSVSGAGDVDADGHADLIVGAPGVVVSGSRSGCAWVLSGRDGSTLHEFVGDPGNRPALIGGEVAWQWFLLDPGVNPLGVVSSNAALWTIGTP